MSQIYRLVSFGASPVDLATMKTFIKATGTSDDVLIQSLIDSATEFGEKYTGREFRPNQWQLLLDSFSDLENSSERFHRQHEHFLLDAETERIELKRDPVDVIDSITHLVDAAPVTVSADDFYLKKLTQSSEILLFEDKDWPDDTDNREQAIEVTFTTKAYRCLNEIINAIKMHVSYLYANRGDCSDGKTAQSAEASGATFIYDQFRISRV